MAGCMRRLLIKCGILKPEWPLNRLINVGHKPLHRGDSFMEEFPYDSNRVVSSRYTAWNFIPKNLFEQFQRIANFYFLCIAIVQLFIDTPVNPVTSILPLIFVIFVTLVKQGFEDFLRHLADNEVNNAPADIVRDGSLLTVKSWEIKVGDVVRIYANQGFPCDMVMISSSESTGACFVTTASLDGETNLKTFLAPTMIRQFVTPEAISADLHALVHCQQPINDLYRFIGKMEVIPVGDSSGIPVTLPLAAENLLLRGARLKNTEFVYGCAVYTGQDTKMALNSKGKKSKFSQVERKLNYFLICFLLLLAFMAILCTSMKYVFSQTFTNVRKAWYIPDESITTWRVVQDLFGFLVLFNYLIPISLYVTIEVIKFVGAFFIGWDLEMFDEASGNRARANTSDLNEELGQIEYLFSDKTGTLTENDMQFRQCSIRGVKYMDIDGDLYYKPQCEGILEDTSPPEPVKNLTPDLEEFFTVLSLCHTVRLERISSGRAVGNGGVGVDGKPTRAISVRSVDGDDYEYQASSPDEKAFVESCRRYGMIYHGVHDDLHVITYKGQRRRYRVLQVLEFDSDRKCMSVIVQNVSDGSYHLHCKGAESGMLSKGVHSDDAVNPDTLIDHVNDYAIEGLRTLVIGTRRLSDSEFKVMDTSLQSARESIEGREEKLAAAYQMVEQKLRLLGCTAIEDRLQDGVKETIEDLRKAGIQVWILTGDKEETAVNISYSAGHFTLGMNEVRITRQNSLEECRQTLLTQQEGVLSASSMDANTKYALVIDGQSLSFALNAQLRTHILTLCMKATTVLCCRMTPLQKAEVVALIKTNVKPEPVTAAIGDGANDVSMILEAHVGIGLYGKEGRQAVRSADYALARFRYLRPALLVHGHLFYVRIATLVQYFFYKNIAFITAQLYFACYSAFSAQTIYDSLYLMLYNLTFTSLPIVGYGLFEQHISRSVLLRKPELYQLISRNRRLSWREFILWNVLGLWHSLVSYFGIHVFFAVNEILGVDGVTSDVASMGTIIIFLVTIIVTAKLFLVTYYWQIGTVICFLITFLGNVFTLILHNVGYLPIIPGYNLYWVWFKLFSYATPWLSLIVLTFVALTPDIICRALQDSADQGFGRQRKFYGLVGMRLGRHCPIASTT